MDWSSYMLWERNLDRASLDKLWLLRPPNMSGETDHSSKSTREREASELLTLVVVVVMVVYVKWIGGEIILKGRMGKKKHKTRSKSHIILDTMDTGDDVEAVVWLFILSPFAFACSWFITTVNSTNDLTFFNDHSHRAQEIFISETSRAPTQISTYFLSSLFCRFEKSLRWFGEVHTITKNKGNKTPEKLLCAGIKKLSKLSLVLSFLEIWSERGGLQSDWLGRDTALNKGLE